MEKRARGILVTLIGVVLVGVCAAPGALADPRVYWTNAGLPQDSGVSWAELDGTGGANFDVSPVTPSGSNGVVIDAAANRLYWADYATDAISYANLSGGGAHTITFSGVTPFGPAGLALDPGGRKLYWGDFKGNTISYAKLDGSGGGHLNTGTATVNGPEGVTVDLAAGKIFWANSEDDAHPISYAFLNGTGGGDLNITGATVSTPVGLALDLAANRVYWANEGNNTISYARLDDTGGGGQLTNTSGATIYGPQGIAIDPVANRIYWANFHDSAHPISYARLDGTGGGHDLDPGIATPHQAGFPALLKPPAAGHIPLVTGKPAVGSTVHCTRGAWAPDLPGSFLFRAPRSFAYDWRRNGTPIPGATQNAIHLTAKGHYRCAVTASNYVGSATQISAVRNVVACVVPTLAHKGLPRARTALRKARCTLGHVTGPMSTSARIKTQSPKPGTQLPPGSKVNVTTQ
jgi:DNA-binding beta-propeller fold protein YncE